MAEGWLKVIAEKVNLREIVISLSFELAILTWCHIYLPSKLFLKLSMKNFRYSGNLKWLPDDSIKSIFFMSCQNRIVWISTRNNYFHIRIYQSHNNRQKRQNVDFATCCFSRELDFYKLFLGFYKILVAIYIKQTISNNFVTHSNNVTT